MGTRAARRTIGFISQTGFDNFPTQMLGGAAKAAADLDCHLLRFTTESTRLEDAYQDQLDYILSIISHTSLDGIVFLGWMTGIQRNPQAFLEKVRAVRDLPLLSAGAHIEGVPSVMMDGRRHMRDLLSHLTDVHGFKRIVFIQPYTKDERYPAYEEFMRERNLFSPELVIMREEIMIRGDHYARIRAKRICSILFDERKLSFDAIVSPFAHEAASILEESRLRGHRIPEDFAVLGWEDGERSKYSVPPITSLYFPFFEIGEESCRVMVRLLDGETVPPVSFVQAKLVIRQSCGCAPENILDTCAILPPDDHLTPSRDELLSSLQNDSDFRLEILDPALLLDLIFQGQDDPEPVIRRINTLLDQTTITIHSINLINQIQQDTLRFSCFLRRMCADKTLTWNAERLTFRILLTLHRRTERELGFNEALNRGESHLLQGINQHIVTTFGIHELLHVIAESLERINIKDCLLFLTSDPDPSTQR
ncbi:MAG TPA: LacI family transcriptional regulator, partial [Spirochaetia bacterium]|nr:LacI family transcriptional regulator [Spirochaetia bacterium]